MWPDPQKTADLVTFTEEILNGKIHFLCSDSFKINFILHTFCSLQLCKFSIGCWSLIFVVISTGIYLIKIYNGNTGTTCGVYSKLTIKTPEQRDWRHWRHWLFWCFHCWFWTSKCWGNFRDIHPIACKSLRSSCCQKSFLQ